MAYVLGFSKHTDFVGSNDKDKPSDVWLRIGHLRPGIPFLKEKHWLSERRLILYSNEIAKSCFPFLVLSVGLCILCLKISILIVVNKLIRFSGGW